MSQENVEIVRQVFETFLAGGDDWLRDGDGSLFEAAFDPDVEYDPSEAGFLDFDSVYRGREALAQFWAQWLSAWESMHFTYELRDAGDRVVALVDQKMRGRATGIEVSFGKYAQILTLDNERIVHWKVYRNASEALEAAGLSG